MACMPLEITHKEVAPVTVGVPLAGKLMLGPLGEEIVTLVEELLRKGDRTIVFDLSGSHGDR